ncbi:Don1p [Saccharomyces eubayanus]|uniref:Don1p n=1 Tax=Saccharomyces eubayanus TaxID=1080349 RepID=UPI0006C56FA7|nr:DON1-like protein [Saccharomyces eubayanus]KOH01102.1 DON1-like protein [Saccharomyces eubayanus]
MGKKNRKGKENSTNRNFFRKVENTKDSSPNLCAASQICTTGVEKEASPTIDVSLVSKKDGSTKTESSVCFDYPTIGNLVSSVEKLYILKELEAAFPDIGKTIIKAILIASQGVLEPAFNSLLYFSNPTENTAFALPMKPISAQEVSKIEIPDILQYEILDDFENEASSEEMEGQMYTSVTFTNTEPEQSSVVNPTHTERKAKPNRGVAESTRNSTMADEHSAISSKEKSVRLEEKKGINGLTGAAVKAISIAKKKSEPSNNLFDILDCDESDEDEEQDIKVHISNQENKDAGTPERPVSKKTGGKTQSDDITSKPPVETSNDGGYKSPFGTDSCDFFPIDAKNPRQVNSSAGNKM